MRRGWLLILLAVTQSAGSSGSCTWDGERDTDPDPPPAGGGVSFSDSFTGGLSFWSLSVPGPTLDTTTGNALPSMRQGSATFLPTGAVTTTTFTPSGGLTISAQVLLPSASSSAWVGLSSSSTVVTTPSLAAGHWIDGAGNRHLVVNGSVVASFAAPSTGAWHTLSTKILATGAVEFRLDGILEFTAAGFSFLAYPSRPVLAGGDGYPDQPRVDNVAVTSP